MIKELENYVVNNFKGGDLQQNLINLFSLYSTFNIYDFKSFKNSPNNYIDFIKQNVKFIADTAKVSQPDILLNLLHIYSILNSDICSESVHKHQVEYTEIVKNLSSSKNSRILDVGAGHIPYSSILLGIDMPNISAMDKSFWLSEECLKNMNVTPFDEYFTTKTPIENFDMIVGRFPCSAIDSIVYLCAKYNKPYFIETCECNIPAFDYFYKKWGIDKKRAGIKSQWQENMKDNFKWIVETDDINKDDFWMIGWQKTLPALDNNINFYGTFAYNTGDNKENVERLIEQAKINSAKLLEM